MFKSAMKYRNVKLCIFIFSSIHLVQCKFAHRRVDDTDNTVQGKPVLSEVDKDGPLLTGDEGGKDTVPLDGESSAPDIKNKDGELSAPDKKEKEEVLDHGENDVAEDDGGGLNGDINENGDHEDVAQSNGEKGKMGNCWFPIEAHTHFIEMDKLDRKYSEVRKEQKAASSKDFDKKMLTAMLKTRAIAERALQHFGGDPNLIPAGLNLGGYCMMRMPQSVLFFHRMKLRNNTRFRVNYLNNDLSDMIVTLRFSLNDLHLMGDYERAITYDSLSTLYYTPTYGELEFLLKDVEYKVEGRYRLLNDRLYVEHIISELCPGPILMRYMKENNTASMTSIRLQHQNIYPYLQRMQNDLDHWLKDYFNDFLIYLDLPETSVNSQNQAYENEKTIVRNRFADGVIKSVRKRLRQVNASSIMIPNFKIYSVSEMEITLYDGVIHGLDTIYRRSVATGKLDSQNVRHLDAIVGFGKLKVEYKYTMFLGTGLPPLFGMVVLDAEDLTGRLALKTVRDSPTLDMHIALIQPFDKPRSLIVEGPANRYIAKYKNILEHQITSIMSSTMIHHIQQLDSLARCQTYLIGKDDPKYKTIDDSESVESRDYKGQTGDGGDVTNSEPEPVTDATNDGGDVTHSEPEPVTDATNDGGDVTNSEPEPVTDATDDGSDVTNFEPEPVTDATDDGGDVTNSEPEPVTDATDDGGDVTNSEPEPVTDATDDGGDVTDSDAEPVTDATDGGDDGTTQRSEDGPKLPEDYIVSRNESMELEFPAKDGDEKGEKMKVEVNEKFSLTRLNKGQRRTG